MNRIGHVAREYWIELLIAVLAVAGMLELVVGRDLPGAPATSLWFSVPAVAVLVPPLFAHRRRKAAVFPKSRVSRESPSGSDRTRAATSGVTGHLHHRTVDYDGCAITLFMRVCVLSGCGPRMVDGAVFGRLLPVCCPQSAVQQADSELPRRRPPPTYARALFLRGRPGRGARPRSQTKARSTVPPP